MLSKKIVRTTEDFDILQFSLMFSTFLFDRAQKTVTGFNLKIVVVVSTTEVDSSEVH